MAISDIELSGVLCHRFPSTLETFHGEFAVETLYTHLEGRLASLTEISVRALLYFF